MPRRRSACSAARAVLTSRRGLSGVDELRAKHEAELERQRAEQRAAVEKARSEDIKSQMNAEQERTSSVEARDEALRERLRRQREQDEAAKLAGGGPQKSAVKPLSSFLDVDKISKESADTIGKLWTGYHALRNKLSAAIPTDTYRQMLDTARRYPQFVLPLPREEAVGEGKEAQRAFEMHYLQWVVLPNETPQGTPPPSAAMIASLAEYKLRQEYAQPSLVLTHYTDLAESKGIVLMRGDITSRQGGEAEGSPMLSQQDAQMLAMCMQRFYRRDEAEPGSSAAAGNEERTNLLRLFHESPGDFDLSKLLDAAFRV